MQHVTASFVLVVFAFVLAGIAAIWTPESEPHRYRLLAAAFACYMASIIVAAFVP